MMIRLTLLFYHDSAKLPYLLCYFCVSLVTSLSISRTYIGPYFLSQFLVRYNYAMLLKQNNSQISGWGY